MYVKCEISEGLRASEVTVAVRDVDNRPEFLRVHREFAQQFDNQGYLPIGVVFYDRESGRDQVLIELPHEADSGTNRLWVPRSSLFEPKPREATALT